VPCYIPFRLMNHRCGVVHLSCVSLGVLYAVDHLNASTDGHRYAAPFCDQLKIGRGS
jgi:hypothetical protein